MTTIRLPTGNYNEKSTYICGVDFAKQGKDETAIVILEQLSFDENIFVVYIDTSHTPDLTVVFNKIVYLNEKFNFKKIICDETGIGSVTDFIKKKIGPKVEGIWYTSRIKAQIFNNLKLLMSRKTGGRLCIPDYTTSTNPIIRKMFYQFLSIQQEFSENEIPKIFHETRAHDDIVNSVALAASYFNVYRTSRKKYPLLGVK